MIKCLTIIEIELESGNVGFWGEGKTGVPGEKSLGARNTANNKLNPGMTPGLGIEPGRHSCRRRGLCSPKTSHLYFLDIQTSLKASENTKNNFHPRQKAFAKSWNLHVRVAVVMKKKPFLWQGMTCGRTREGDQQGQCLLPPTLLVLGQKKKKSQNLEEKPAGQNKTQLPPRPSLSSTEV